MDQVLSGCQFFLYRDSPSPVGKPHVRVFSLGLSLQILKPLHLLAFELFSPSSPTLQHPVWRKGLRGFEFQWPNKDIIPSGAVVDRVVWIVQMQCWFSPHRRYLLYQSIRIYRGIFVCWCGSTEPPSLNINWNSPIFAVKHFHTFYRTIILDPWAFQACCLAFPFPPN